jgi:hypothetical protein
MKPKPLSALNHFTRPVILADIEITFDIELVPFGAMVCLTEFLKRLREAHDEGYLWITSGGLLY